MSTALASFDAWKSAPSSVKKEALDFEAQRARLVAMRSEAQKANSRDLRTHCDLELRRFEKAHSFNQSGSNALIRQWLQNQREDQAAQIQKLRLENEEARAVKRREQKVRLRHRIRHHLVKEERKRQTV